MTAEITVFNKEAIALASDSAVTLTLESGEKILTSANKLFALSDYHPVGIMVYNNAYFMEVPWETLTKTYKTQLPKEGFNKLHEYSGSFISFLEANSVVCPEHRQQDFVRRFLVGYFSTIREKIENEVARVIEENGKIDEEEISETVTKLISDRLRSWSSTKRHRGSSITMRRSELVITKYKEQVDEAIKAVFQQLPISDETSEELFSMAINLYAKGSDPDLNSGVIIAGFGEEEVFPSIEVFTFDGIADNKLKYVFNKRTRVGEDTDGGVFAFAQREMAVRFMEGVDPLYEELEEKLLVRLCSRYADAVVDHMQKYDAAEKEELKRQLLDYGERLAKEYQKRTSQFKKEYFADPITNIVSYLPKSDLATLAESLVSLTLLKLKFSPESETVAGPIDVAVISKMDGFVWVRRKKYSEFEASP